MQEVYAQRREFIEVYSTVHGGLRSQETASVTASGFTYIGALSDYLVDICCRHSTGCGENIILDGSILSPYRITASYVLNNFSFCRKHLRYTWRPEVQPSILYGRSSEPYDTIHSSHPISNRKTSAPPRLH